ncbi:MAG TPA: polysaccharide deacetylase family protein [Nitrospiria bacterium]|nr:polysaccharide deacetylase family protein [Nitrospiria bacterium]HUK55083.1 polysaccharide deacetylase family protein [Nitrospiria bacterium]
MTVKSKIREALARGYYLTRRLSSRLEGKVLILAYHRVLSEKELKEQFVQPGMYVRDDAFERQMRFLREYFRILSFDELLGLWDRGGWDGRQRYCVVTLDDGWLDNYLHAYPVLRKYEIPATVFLPTSFIGTREWFWPEKLVFLLDRYIKSGQKERLTALWGRWPRPAADGNGGEGIDSIIEICKGLPEGEVEKIIGEIGRGSGIAFPPERSVVNWKEVEEMSASGISFGSHSATHKILTKLSREEVRNELKTSFDTLRGKKIKTVPVFCYPNGNFDPAVAELVREAGYRAAVTTQFGFESESPADRFGLKRIGVHQDIGSTDPLFSWHLSGMNRF